MIATGTEDGALLKLLRLAREEHAALREDLRDLGAARKAAELSLAQTGVAVARRRRIMAMLATYEAAESAAREKLAEAAGQARRLEMLMRGQASRRAATAA